MAGQRVRIFAGRPPVLPAGAIQVEVGQQTRVAFAGLRRILKALHAEAEASVEAVARSAPAEWNRLFPGGIPHAQDLSDLAVTPSERRLHRESEQVFRILNTGARAILDALAATGRPLVLRGAGACDLVSLRGLMRTVEAARLRPERFELWLTDWRMPVPGVPASFVAARQAFLDQLQKRMRVTQVEGNPDRSGPLQTRISECLEGRYLARTLDPAAAREDRIAAALLAIRACFFSTHYEGALLAAETADALLGEGACDESAVAAAWAAQDDPLFATATVELEPESLGDAATLRALVQRQVGVVHAFIGDFEGALDAFDRALGHSPTPEGRAELRMYRALTKVKRLGQLPAAREELAAGLSEVHGKSSRSALLQTGWLRNLGGLVCFLEKRLDAAMDEERLAISCMQGQETPSAAHLMTNLVSNVSVLQEAGKQYPLALASWRTFETISGDWGPSFAKHHRYRRAGLRRLAGDRDGALADCAEAYQHAGEVSDEFHRQAIAGETGKWLLELGDRSGAAVWFERAVQHATSVAEPLRVAESLAGLAVAKGTRDFSAARAAIAQSSTYPAEAAKLTEALTSGDPERVQAALPNPRTKLNRPFDVVNL